MNRDLVLKWAKEAKRKLQGRKLDEGLSAIRTNLSMIILEAKDTNCSHENPFRRGQLVFWVTRDAKFWGLIANTRRRSKSAYLISYSSGHSAPWDQLEVATVDQVVRYMRRKWGHGTAATVYEIEHTRELHRLTDPDSLG